MYPGLLNTCLLWMKMRSPHQQQQQQQQRRLRRLVEARV
jgi:hypothetical protein